MAELCAPRVAPETLISIASVESSFNPFAIGVVGGRLQRQPRSLSEALATADMLETQGYNYSVGVLQVNKKNFATYGLTTRTAFDPCANLRAGSLIFLDCFERAGASTDVLGDALSCYYSGNFTTGHRHGYVAKVKAAGAGKFGGLQGVPIPVISNPKPAKVRSATPSRVAEPLFVTAATRPAVVVADPGGASSTPMSKESALLF